VRKDNHLTKLGLSLEEIGAVIHLYLTDPSSVQPKRKVLANPRAHLAEANWKIGALQHFRAELKGHFDRFQRRVAENGERWQVPSSLPQI
jgi:hypothetical protein